MAGRVSEYGPKLTYTDTAKPQCSFTLIHEKDGGYKTFIPVFVVGPKAEDVAEVLQPHELVLLEGSLSYRKGRAKESGRLEVVTFDVMRLQSAETPASVSPN